MARVAANIIDRIIESGRKLDSHDVVRSAGKMPGAAASTKRFQSQFSARYETDKDRDAMGRPLRKGGDSD